MIHIFLESPGDLVVYTSFRFLIFENNSPKLVSKITLYGYVMLTKGSIALRLWANYMQSTWIYK